MNTLSAQSINLPTNHCIHTVPRSFSLSGQANGGRRSWEANLQGGHTFNKGRSSINGGWQGNSNGYRGFSIGGQHTFSNNGQTSIGGSHSRNNFGYRRNEGEISHNVGPNLRIKADGFRDNMGGRGYGIGFNYRFGGK